MITTNDNALVGREHPSYARPAPGLIAWTTKQETNPAAGPAGAAPVPPTSGTPHPDAELLAIHAEIQPLRQSLRVITEEEDPDFTHPLWEVKDALEDKAMGMQPQTGAGIAVLLRIICDHSASSLDEVDAPTPMSDRRAPPPVERDPGRRADDRGEGLTMSSLIPFSFAGGDIRVIDRKELARPANFLVRLRRALELIPTEKQETFFKMLEIILDGGDDVENIISRITPLANEVYGSEIAADYVTGLRERLGRKAGAP